MVIPQAVHAASSDYLEDEDLFGQFLASETVKVVGAFVATSAIKSRYQKWSGKQGIEPLSDKVINNEIRARGFIGLELRQHQLTELIA